MAKRQSRLQETDYSQFNLRDAYITDIAAYVAALRDSSIFDNYGIKVLIRIPVNNSGELNENNVDCYSNFVDVTWKDTTETVIPLFNEYRQNVSIDGLSADGTDGIYPLTVILPTKLHLPKNSRIIFSEYNSNEEQISREWTVLGTQMKQLSGSKTYSRVANCVPSRQGSFDSGELSQGTIWFDYTINDNLEHFTDIRAQGRIWFLGGHILDTIGINVIRKALILEQGGIIYPEYDEDHSILMYYDTRPVNIIDGGVGFMPGDFFELKDKEGQPIYIIVKGGARVPLALTVTKVDKETGAIQGFDLNLTEGYTIFGPSGETFVEIEATEGYPATIRLMSNKYEGSIYDEEVDTPVIENPRFLTPYRVDTVFSAKKISLGITN